MTTTEMKSKVAALSDSGRTRLLADSWTQAQSGLRGIADDDDRETPVSQYLLQILCLAVENKEGFHNKTSAEKEITVERMKAVLKPVEPLLKNRTDMLLPSYSLVSKLTPREGEQSVFADQLKEDFKRLNQQAADALAVALYAVVYAFYRDFDDGACKRFLRFYVDGPYDAGNLARMAGRGQIHTPHEAAGRAYGTPRTTASAAYTAAPVSGASGSAYRPVRTPGKWLPLKLYLIVTTLFVALVFGLVFWAMSGGEGASAMSIMDTSGQMVSIEPGMEPATLLLFGTVGYDELISGIKTAAIVFVIWRVALTTAVYIFNARRRRRHHV